MTEDEAKTKWCPMVRVLMSSKDGNSFEPSFNRMVLEDDPQTPRIGGAMNCIGSACMMWRWQTDPDGRQMMKATDIPPSKIGYCGLAGEP